MSEDTECSKKTEDLGVKILGLDGKEKVRVGLP